MSIIYGAHPYGSTPPPVCRDCACPPRVLEEGPMMSTMAQPAQTDGSGNPFGARSYSLSMDQVRAVISQSRTEGFQVFQGA